ncbi:MAG: ABC transporter transmembrane domain-containing protein [Pseudomonadota bacterium]
MQIRQKREIFFKLYEYLRVYQLHLIASGIALSVAATTIIAIGQGLRLLVDRGFGSQTIASKQTLLFLTIMALLMGAASFLRSYLSSWIGERVVVDLKQKIFRGLIYRSPAFFDSLQVGDLMSRLDTDTHLIQILIGRSASTGLRSLIQFIGAFIMLFLTSPQLAVLTCIASFIALMPLFLFGRQVYIFSNELQKNWTHASAYSLERLECVTTVQAFAQENSVYTHYQNNLKQGLITANKLNITSSLMSASVIILITLGACVILWFGGHEVVNHQLTPGTLVSFLFYAVIIAGSVGNLSEAWKDLQRALGAAERVFSLLPDAPITKPKVRAINSPVRGDIEFQNVTFSYPSRPEIKALENISLNIKHGDTVAFVGPSGSGKSSLFNLLLGFYAPQQGKVLLDRVQINSFAPQQLRPHIGWIPQEPILFSGSICDNIKFANSGTSFQKVEKAALQANALEFIRRLPDGFATQVGEKGVQLSVGQKQQLVIARLFLQNPSILLLDEVTTALDAENVDCIQAALGDLKQGRTTLMVTHNLSTILNFDRIIVMNQGKIIASGNHTTLMRQNELYRRFVALQFSDTLHETSAATPRKLSFA